MTSVYCIIRCLYVFFFFFSSRRRHTRCGRDWSSDVCSSDLATGMNPKMARAQGINTNIKIILGLAIANALIALSGGLYAQVQRTANMDAGRGTIVIGLASIILGEVIFGKRSFKNWLISVILGSIIFQAILGIAIRVGLNPNDLKLVQAIIIAIILALPLVQSVNKKIKRTGVGSNA